MLCIGLAFGRVRGGEDERRSAPRHVRRGSARLAAGGYLSAEECERLSRWWWVHLVTGGFVDVAG